MTFPIGFGKLPKLDAGYCGRREPSTKVALRGARAFFFFVVAMMAHFRTYLPVRIFNAQTWAFSWGWVTTRICPTRDALGL